MTKKQIIRELKKYKKMNVLEQALHKKEILELFDRFLETNPTEKQFGDATGSLIIFSEMIYKMTLGRKQVKK